MNYLKKHWFGILFFITVILTVIVALLYIALFKFYGVNGQLEILGTMMAQKDMYYYVLMTLGLVSSLISMFLFTYLMYFKKVLLKTNAIMFRLHFYSTILIWAIDIAIMASSDVMMISFAMAFVYMVAIAMWQEKHKGQTPIVNNDNNKDNGKPTIADKNVKMFKKAVDNDKNKESDVKNGN